jgi:hypothetical protein
MLMALQVMPWRTAAACATAETSQVGAALAFLALCREVESGDLWLRTSRLAVANPFSVLQLLLRSSKPAGAASSSSSSFSSALLPSSLVVIPAGNKDRRRNGRGGRSSSGGGGSSSGGGGSNSSSSNKSGCDVDVDGVDDGADLAALAAAWTPMGGKARASATGRPLAPDHRAWFLVRYPGVALDLGAGSARGCLCLQPGSVRHGTVPSSAAGHDTNSGVVGTVIFTKPGSVGMGAGDVLQHFGPGVLVKEGRRDMQLVPAARAT